MTLFLVKDDHSRRPFLVLDNNRLNLNSPLERNTADAKKFKVVPGAKYAILS